MSSTKFTPWNLLSVIFVSGFIVVSIFYVVVVVVVVVVARHGTNIAETLRGD